MGCISQQQSQNKTRMKSCRVGKDPQQIPCSAQSLVICIRFWKFQVVLLGLLGLGTNHIFTLKFFFFDYKSLLEQIYKTKINKRVTLKPS